MKNTERTDRYLEQKQTEYKMENAEPGTVQDLEQPQALIEKPRHRFDKKSVLCYTSCFVFIAVGVFSIYELARADNCTDKSPYLVMISLLLGILLPSPVN